MKKAELLAPAGNYESFLGAIHAGADAVYLGGNRFGARAYADNFTEEEICRAVRYAHLRGRKVYLTVNTLVKEREFSALPGYLEPFYEAGLDAVIIQDMGVFEKTGEWFPDLPRHISTQMTVTGAYGAAYMKERGADRIVPARELSLSEIRDIKEKTGVELETFIHGAVCYCYSGQCLFSSILGGRSGNRGRCAQPCRLPYQAEVPGTLESGTLKGRQKEQYPLSLKDMCTLEILPDLIEAGIDSFKIEGRMKSPEYVAGVTAVYRKYIDRYYEKPDQEWVIKEEDMQQLRSLYMRTGISEGYYKRHNGKEMVTLNNPGYSGTDGKRTEDIRKKYLSQTEQLPAEGKVCLKKGTPAKYTVSCMGISAEAEGQCVQEAKTRPLTEEEVQKQLLKSGNTFFSFDRVETDMDASVFLPVRELNELRRNACENLERELIKKNGYDCSRRKTNYAGGEMPETVTGSHEKAAHIQRKKTGPMLHVSVLTEQQLDAALTAGAERIYLSSDLFETEKAGKTKNDKIRKMLLRAGKETAVYLSLPYILRKRDDSFLLEIQKLLKEKIFAGVLVRNLEEMQWLDQIAFPEDRVTDCGIYMWNRASAGAFEGEKFLPLELNVHELEELLTDTDLFSCVVYGRIPMMVSANCVAKTMDGCQRSKDKESVGRFCSLRDRYRKIFPVYLNCRHCYNVIYNTVPLSLHQQMKRLRTYGIYSLRLDFTTEDKNETEKIITFFKKIAESEEESNRKPPFLEYTNGHFKRGVE